MKKLFLLFFLITSLLPAQTFDGIKNFPPMTIFGIERKDGEAYYIRLDEEKRKAVHKLGEFKLYDKDGKKIKQDINAATFDEEGYLWFVSNTHSRKRGLVLFRINGEQFKSEAAHLKVEYIGELGLKLKNYDNVTGLVFDNGVLYGVTGYSHYLLEINTTTGEAKILDTFDGERSDYFLGLVKAAENFYIFKSSSYWYACHRNSYSVYKFDSFPSVKITPIATLNLKGASLRTATGHSNGFVYVGDEEKFVKLDFAEMKAEVVLRFCSGIGGMAFFLPNETPQTIDKNFADLSLQGEVDNPKPNNGDKVQFTFTLKNSGPDKATNIVVKSTLQKGLEFISASPDAGSAEDSSNVITWKIPSLEVNAQAVLKIVTQLNIKDANKSIFNLGPAKGFNVFVIHNADSLTSDTEGKMFVGNYAHLGSAYSVGYELRNDSLDQDVLIVGHTLEYGPKGAIYGGNVVFGKDTIFHDFNPDLDIVNGKLIKDWKKAQTLKKKSYLLKQLSARLYKYTPNGKTTLEFSTLRLNGKNPFLNVFSVEESQIENATDFIVNVPNGSVVLINFKDKYSDKDTLFWGGGLKVYGADYSNVIYNFYKTKHLFINGINVTGTILAPKTDVIFKDGQQNGQMIAYNLQGHAQYNNTLFVGNLPYDTTLYAVSEIVDVDQVDTNSTPNNGVISEDDFVSLAVVYDSRGASSGSGQTTFKWELVGKFKSDELVWTMEPEGEGTFLVGTWGGNIYRTDSAKTWTLLNENQMDSVTYIWAIKKLSDGKIFVGTERGVYASFDNGKTWSKTGFTNGDVRCLAFDGKILYAGTWGDGLYKSDDEGKTWKKANNSIPKASVVGLTINKNGELFIGTFDLGLFKSDDGGESVTQLNIEYPYIWSLGKSENGVLYAGTYGNGLYSSADNGQTWGREFPVEANYIYSIRTKGNKIYASSWEEGVFTGVIKSYQAKSAFPTVASGSTVEWYDMGLSGYGVSSVLPSNDGKYVYAGTNEGEIYRAETSITKVEKGGEVPSDFALVQNYPNPFGKKTKAATSSTLIEYKIGHPAFVTLKIYDVLGREIKTLVKRNENPGIYKVSFNATNLPSGIYFYRLQAGKFVDVKKMIYLK